MTIGPWRSPPSLPTSGDPGGLHPSRWQRPTPGSAATGQLAAERSRPPVPVPPAPMPMARDGRVLKRWTYLGIFSPELMLCAGTARVGPLPQRFWALWDRQTAVLDTETVALAGGRRIAVAADRVRVRAGDSRLELAVSVVGPPVEVVSPDGSSYIWTRKTPVRAEGHYALGMQVRPVRGYGVLDESAGYHGRHTEWEWSAGIGCTLDGRPVAWNLTRGVHDAETSSERTVWVNGRPLEVPSVRFSTDLDELWGRDGTLLGFQAEASRSQRQRLGLVSSDYVQPFGTFTGTLPGGIELSPHEPALGVMERHQAIW